MRGIRHQISPLAVAILIALLLSGIAAQESVATRVPVGSPTIPTTKIDCFGPESNHYVGKVEPSNCEIWGRVEFAGFLEGESRKRIQRGAFGRLAVREIEWDSWGETSARGYAALVRSGRETAVNAYRRVRCADGSTWYAKANVFKDTGVFYELRLPVCGRPLSACNDSHGSWLISGSNACGGRGPGRP